MQTLKRWLFAASLLVQTVHASSLEFSTDTTPDGHHLIMVTGEFVANDDLKQFERLVARSQANVVSFDSPGGHIYKAMELGRAIRRLELGTIAVRPLECA